MVSTSPAPSGLGTRGRDSPNPMKTAFHLSFSFVLSFVLALVGYPFPMWQWWAIFVPVSIGVRVALELATKSP